MIRAKLNEQLKYDIDVKAISCKYFAYLRSNNHEFY